MTWNHRVVRRGYPNGEHLYEIHEVYYDSEGKIEFMTEDPIDPVGDNLEELRVTLERMTRCLDKPVLDYETRARSCAKKAADLC